MRVHFFPWHVRYTIIILEEGNLPQPRRPRYDMLVTCRILNGRHLDTAQCTKGGGEKLQTTVGGGAAGEFGEGFSGLWLTSGDSHLVQLLGTDYDGGGRLLANGDGKLNKGSEELDA